MQEVGKQQITPSKGHFRSVSQDDTEFVASWVDKGSFARSSGLFVFMFDVFVQRLEEKLGSFTKICQSILHSRIAFARCTIWKGLPSCIENNWWITGLH